MGSSRGNGREEATAQFRPPQDRRVIKKILQKPFSSKQRRRSAIASRYLRLASKLRA
jgi:hypothetical protein